MAQLVLDNVNIEITNEGDNILSLVTGGQEISGTLSQQQLLDLKEAIETILDPQRRLRLQLNNLKKFKRTVFTHYRQATDPEVKAQKLQLYIETKKMITEIEQGV